MVDTNAVILRMTEMGIKQRDVAQAWSCAQSTVSLKLNNKRPLMLDEARILQILLKISDEEFCSYFYQAKLRSATNV